MDFLRIAIEKAVEGMEKGELPIGAVIVKNGEIIASCHNEKEMRNDPTAHAEILAIREATKVLGDWRLNGCEMYVTLEPCPMCISAIAQSRIDRVYIGTYNRDMGACGTVIDLAKNYELKTNVDLRWLCSDECKELMQSFFIKRRNENKKCGKLTKI